MSSQSALALLFFKRVCDVWDEEHTAMLAEYGEDFADEHRFQVPEKCHWRKVRAAPKNVGTALANAMRGVEAANQKHLSGVFGDAQWTNKDRLPDELLKDLIEQRADDEFERLGMKFQSLWGRSLQLIDCQNVFCEVSKYARVAQLATPRMLRELAGGHDIRLGMSIGIATRWPAMREGLDETLQRADQAMYQAKRAGRGQWRAWRPEVV